MALAESERNLAPELSRKRVRAARARIRSLCAVSVRVARRLFGRVARKGLRSTRVVLRRLLVQLARTRVNGLWVSRGILWVSPEYERSDAQAWTDALERVLVDRPDAILKHRRGAFYRAWGIGDIGLAMDYMDRYRAHQESLRERLGLGVVRMSISRNILTANHSVHGYLDAHLKAMKLGWAPERSIVALIAKNQDLNPVMTRYWSRYVRTVLLDGREPPALSAMEELFNEDLTIAAHLHGKSVYIEHAKAQVQAEWERQGREPLLRFESEDVSGCSSALEPLGLPRGAPFVTLHVRDNGSKTGSWKNSGTGDDYRNADVLSYLEAVKRVTDMGWCVVRVGDPAMKPIPTLPGLIDYAHSSIRTSLLDVYLFSQCRFFIGTSSGPILVPHLFGTPVVGTNYAPMSARLHAGNTLLLLKRLRHHTGRYVTFEEALTTPIGSLFHTEAIRDAGYEYEDNSSEEITAAVEEMLETLAHTITYSPEDERLSASIDALYAAHSGYGSLGRMASTFARGCSDRQMI